jgi:glutathione S-transferase
LIVGDLYDRVRPEDKKYIAESRGARLGTTDFTSFQMQAREKGLTAFRTSLEPARRALREQKFLSGAEAAYPDYILAGTFMWPRTLSPFELLESDDPVHAWRERMLDLFDGMARKAKAA